jgi:cytochrome P450
MTAANISKGTARRQPPGPPGRLLLGHARDLQSRALDFFLELARDYGDVAAILLLNRTGYVVSHPDGIRQILQRNHGNYDRNITAQQPLRYFLGNGLPLSDGPLWRHQRRLMQPAFHRERVSALTATMASAAADMLHQWQVRSGRGEVMNIHHEMLQVTLRIAGATLFGLNLADRRTAMGGTFEAMVHELAEYVFLPLPPLTVPTRRNRRIRATVRSLDGLVRDVITERRRHGGDTDDLLAMLLAASNQDGRPITDQQLRDEIISVLFAGYETTANTLTWACHELSRHAEIQHSLWAEVDTVLGGRPPTAAQLTQLPGTRAVIDEVLRVYPPTFALPRHAIAADTICGYHIPADTVVWANIYAVHRHPGYWTRPEVFDPDRFSADGSDPGVRHAYFPFGGGPHLCIGNAFALTEAQLLLAMIVQRYRLRPASAQPIQPVVELTVRPRGGVPLFVLPR